MTHHTFVRYRQTVRVVFGLSWSGMVVVHILFSSFGKPFDWMEQKQVQGIHSTSYERPPGQPWYQVAMTCTGGPSWIEGLYQCQCVFEWRGDHHHWALHTHRWHIATMRAFSWVLRSGMVVTFSTRKDRFHDCGVDNKLWNEQVWVSGFNGQM